MSDAAEAARQFFARGWPLSASRASETSPQDHPQCIRREGCIHAATILQHVARNLYIADPQRMIRATVKRDSATTDDFIQDLRGRVIGVPEISTDGLHYYKNAIRDAFGSVGELRCPIDCHEQVELTLLSSHLGDVDVEVADGIGLELLLSGLVTLCLGQTTDPMSLEATMQG